MRRFIVVLIPAGSLIAWAVLSIQQVQPAQAVTAPGPGPAAQLSGAAEALMQADREFAAAVAAGGAASWASWFAEDGAMIQPGAGEIRGRAAIREFMAVLDDPNVSLSWAPDRADIAASGDLGWTTGRYVMRSRAPDGAETNSEGLYVSIWRREPGDAWKVVMDLGNPLAAAPQ